MDVFFIGLARQRLKRVSEFGPTKYTGSETAPHTEPTRLTLCLSQQRIEFLQ